MFEHTLTSKLDVITKVEIEKKHTGYKALQESMLQCYGMFSDLLGTQYIPDFFLLSRVNSQ